MTENDVGSLFGRLSLLLGEPIDRRLLKDDVVISVERLEKLIQLAEGKLLDALIREQVSHD